MQHQLRLQYGIGQGARCVRVYLTTSLQVRDRNMGRSRFRRLGCNV